MVVAGPGSVPSQVGERLHGGEGKYTLRTLMAAGFASGLKYIRDITLHPNSSIGNHPHVEDEEVYFIIAGHGLMEVDGERARIGPGDAVLTRSGSTHGLINDGLEDLRLFVVCAK